MYMSYRKPLEKVTLISVKLDLLVCLSPQVDMSKVNLEVIKPWITKRVTEILGFEDDVVIEFIFNQLEVKV